MPYRCVLEGRTEREGTLTHKPGSVNGKCQSDRGQAGNRRKTPDRAVGSLGHLGYLRPFADDEAPEYHHGDASSSSPSASLRPKLLLY